MKKTILAFGELLWDILPSCTILGGAPFNFVYRVNSLGDMGLMVSRIGRDELGQKAFNQVTQLGLDTTYIQWDEHLPTGTVQVSFDEDNNPDFVIIPKVAYDQIELTDTLVDAASTADCLCFGTLSQRSEESRKTIEHLLERAGQSLKLLDINLRKDCYSLETVSFSLQKTDILKLNGDEARQLGRMLGLSQQNIPGFCEEMLAKWSLEHCVVTLGEKGAFAMSAAGEKVYVPGYRVKLADSIGSGDAFSAGFVHQILRGTSISQAARFGNVLGALVATKEGATSPVTLDEINLFRNQNFERDIYPDLEEFIN
ncbi:MAG TPA: carbohydrate kinase [Sedimentisphaerales bacterium]|nr:carbohydrate kinase [Sedimentisphaerales bacterium]